MTAALVLVVEMSACDDAEPGKAAGGPGGSATGGQGGSGGGGHAGESFEVVLSGAIQKGPLIIGSTLEIALLDTLGNPTGEVFPTTTTNDLGEFEATFAHSGPISIVGEGFHYNELTGSVSTAPIALRAVHAIAMPGPQAAYVNAVTHLSEKRVLELLLNAGITTAVVQAEQELVTALAIGPPGLLPGPGIEMNLLGGASLTNAYLFAVSAVLTQAAAIEAGPTGSVDGELQELANHVAIDMQDGNLDPARALLVAEAEQLLVPELAMTHLVARAAELGALVVAPDLNTVIDTDQDDIANASDTCAWVWNPAQTPILDQVCHAFAGRLAGISLGGGMVFDVRLADFDGDLDLDAAILDDTQQLSLLQGDGLGGFNLVVQQPFSGYRLVIDDFDADGHLDIVTEPNGGEIHAYLGSGALVAFPPAILSTIAEPNARRAVAGNMNGDLYPDLLAVKQFNSDGSLSVPIPAHVLVHDGNGTFTDVGEALGVVPAGTSFTGPFFHATADLDTDGNLDALLVGSSSNFASIVVLELPGDGAGALGGAIISTSAAPPPADTIQPGDALLDDVTGDGLLDVVVVGRGSTIFTLPGGGDGTFGTAIASNVGADLEGALVATVGDFTGDGVVDIVVTAPGIGDASLAVLPNLGSGSFGPAVVRVARLFGPGRSVGAASNLGRPAASQDFDGNGADDLLVGFTYVPDRVSSPTAELAMMWFTP